MSQNPSNTVKRLSHCEKHMEPEQILWLMQSLSVASLFIENRNLLAHLAKSISFYFFMPAIFAMCKKKYSRGLQRRNTVGGRGLMAV